MTLVEKQTGYFNSFDDTKIYYEIHGTGKPLVFAYGIGCLINHWQPQIDDLSKKYQAIIFDYRGHHHSSVPKDIQTMTTESVAKDMLALLDHLKIKKAGFLGHSFGGQVITAAHNLEPQRFSNIILVNGFASNPIQGMYGSDLPTKIFHLIKTAFDTLPDSATVLWRGLVNSPLSARLSALAGGFNLHLTQIKDIEIYLSGISAIPLEVFLNLFEDMMAFDGRPFLESIKVPVLLIGGAKDAITPQKYQEEMKAAIQNCSLMMVPYGSHCSQLDFSDYVNLKIEKFLKENRY
jgi:pimeloyl-ACP methyl ester carboxylesterase